MLGKNATLRRTNHGEMGELFVNGRITYPTVKDKNGDSWAFYIEKSYLSEGKEPLNGAQFSVYVQCAYNLYNVFSDRPSYQQRIKEILQTENFKFSIQLLTFQEFFEDRLHARIVRAYEAFRQDIKNREFIKKKEALITHRFNDCFNFGSQI